MSAFHTQALAAQKNFRVTASGYTAETVYVEAEAGTGSRYAVTVSLLPAHGTLGGTHLVSVIQPWQTCWPITDLFPIHVDYALERWKNPARRAEEVHGGDAMAVTMAINHAILNYDEWTGRMK